MPSATYIGPDENAFLFVPNLIGYTRVLLLGLACYFMLSDPLQCCVYYILSAFMDVLDGHAARCWGQCTKFGAVLDMVTDRVATSLLMVGLAVLYPSHAFAFQLLIALDLGSHWMAMTATHATNAGSHKSIDLSKNVFLYYYYTSRPCLFFVCACNEWLWMMLYVARFLTADASWDHGDDRADPMAALLTPPSDDCGWAFPIRIGGATLSVWQWIGLACLPVVVFKNMVNVIQLCTSSVDIVGVDHAERQLARSEDKSKRE